MRTTKKTEVVQMSLIIVRDDLVMMRVDAIVNSTNERLQPRGRGVDASIHLAAGERMERELAAIGHCAPGQAVLTTGGELPCKYVIHTVGPVWQGGNEGEELLLRSCYRNVLKKAAEASCTSIAVPILSAGAYGYPKRTALTIATEEIRTFLEENESDMEVSIVVYNREMVEIADGLFQNVEKYIGENYPERKRRMLYELGACAPASATERRSRRNAAEDRMENSYCCSMQMEMPKEESIPRPKAALPDFSHIGPIDGIQLDESFGEAVIRLREEKKIKSSKLCLDANITKAVLSNIVQSVPGGSKQGYRPQKTTAIAVGIALKLEMKELNELLGKAGYVLTRSSLTDVIVEYFVTRKNFNVYEINEVLFAYDQSLLGSA